MLKKPHVSDCRYKKNGDFNPTFHDWLGGERERDREREIERERERERDRERETEREVVSTTEESEVGESG